MLPKGQLVARVTSTASPIPLNINKGTCTTPQTIEWWINVYTHQSSSTLLIGDNTNPCFKFTFNNGPELYHLDSSSNLQRIGRYFSVNKWHHFALVLNSAGRIYVDYEDLGSFDGSQCVSGDTVPMVLSGMSVLVKQVRFWSAELSAEQLKSYSTGLIAEANLCSVNSFEPLATYLSGYPVHEGATHSFIKQPGAVPFSGDFGSRETTDDEYFTGTKYKSSTLLHIKMGETPGVMMPLKSRARGNFDWTLEAWVYLISTDALTPIVGIGGSSTLLSISATKGTSATLISELQYGQGTATNEIPSLAADSWNYVSLTSHLNDQWYKGELGLNCRHYKSSVSILPVASYTFDFLYLGMNKQAYYSGNEIGLREVRVWMTPLSKETLAYQMHKTIKDSAEELRLLYYFPFDVATTEEYEDKAFEGQFQVNRLWGTRHNYEDGGSDPEGVVAPKVVLGSELQSKVPALVICDERSFYNSETVKCEEKSENAPLSLEQSTATFTLPLANYVFSLEWTFEFWILVESITGLSTSILKQTCSPVQNGSVSLRMIGVTDVLEFSMTGADKAIRIAESESRWIHYSFVNDVYQGLLRVYRNGVQYETLAGQKLPLPSCDVAVVELSNLHGLVGKFKEFRIWNGTKTGSEVSKGMHAIPSLCLDYSLVFYLPMAESYGDALLELVQNRSVPLTIPTHSREVWTSQSDLLLCKPPFVYYEKENACMCKCCNERRPEYESGEGRCERVGDQL